MTMIIVMGLRHVARYCHSRGLRVSCELLIRFSSFSVKVSSIETYNLLRQTAV